jgi:hypothetical protein
VTVQLLLLSSILSLLLSSCFSVFSSRSISSWLPLWSSGQSSYLHIQRSGFDSRRYQIFWEVVGLERGSLSLVSKIEELFGRKSSGSGLENQEYGHRDPSRWPCGTLYRQTLVLISPPSGGRSVGIVRSRTQATEFVVCLFVCLCLSSFSFLIYVTNMKNYCYHKQNRPRHLH